MTSLSAESKGRAVWRELRAHWGIVLTTAVGLVLGTLSWFTRGAYLEPISRELDWSVSAISAGMVFNAVGSMISAPFIGRFMDRHGVRRVVLAGIPLYALSYAAFGLVGGSIVTFYALCLVNGACGMAPHPFTYSRAINGWFSVGRGTALGLMSSGVGLSAMIGPMLVVGAVDHYGWRMGYYLNGLAILLVLPIMAVGLRDPQAAAPAAGQGSPAPESGYTNREAVRLPVFWILGTANFIWLLCVGGLFHLLPFLTKEGLTRADAATAVGVLGIATAAGRILGGMLYDRFRAPLVCASIFIVEGLGFAVLALFGAKYAALGIAVIGFAHGSETSGFSYCIARYFGLRAYGEISGWLNIFATLGNGLGPLCFSLVFDVTGDYAWPFGIWAGLTALAASLMLVAARYPFLRST